MNEKELQEYQEYLASQGFTPEEAKEYILESKVVSEPSTTAKVLDGAGRVLDYAGGLSRTAAAGLVDPFVKEDLVTNDDVINALKGKAPGSAEYMDRAGVPEGAKVNLFPEMTIPGTDITLGKGDSSMRDIGGFIGDTALDPLSYTPMVFSKLAKGGKAVKAAEAATTPFSKMLAGTGKKIYKSGLKKIDQEAIKYGKEPVSDVLMKNRIAGGYNKINKKMDTLADDLLAKQKAILAEADQAGKTVDMSKSMTKAEDMIEKMRQSRDPKLQKAADALEDQVSQYKKLDSMPEGISGPRNAPIGVQQANDFKTSITESLPKGAWAESVSGMHPQSIKGEKTMARGLREGVEGAAEQIGKGKELTQINDDLGRILTTSDKAQAEAFKEANKNMFSSVDGIIAGAKNPWMLAAKKAADIAKMTGPRAYTGRALNDFGTNAISAPVIDALGRRGVTETLKNEDVSLWDMIKKKP